MERQEPLVWKLFREIKKYLEPSKRYCLAVSGGADSLALADAAWLAFADSTANLRVCHVEHGIRGAEALQDAQLVADFCRERKLDFVCHHVDVPSYAKEKGCSIEEAARSLRYAKLLEEAERFQAEAIVTAHQADDQAETVLWKLLRGAGMDGLSGMQAAASLGSVQLLRPFLEVSRAELEQYCELRGLHYCVDSTNSDVTYTRNRIRRELLPYLAREFNPNIKETLLREAKVLAEEQECLQHLAEKYLQDSSFCGMVEDEKGLWLSGRLLSELPAALRKRILRLVFFRLGGKELSYERTLALDRLCREGTGGKLVQLPSGFVARYYKKKIFIGKGE